MKSQLTRPRGRCWEQFAKGAPTFLLGFVSAARDSRSSWNELRHPVFSKWGSDSKKLGQRGEEDISWNCTQTKQVDFCFVWVWDVEGKKFSLAFPEGSGVVGG